MNAGNRYKLVLFCWLIGCFLAPLSTDANSIPDKNLYIDENADLGKGIQLLNTSMQNYFTTDDMIMHRFYNPFTNKRSEEKASVWMYTSAIEAVNSILKSLQHSNQKDLALKYEDLLERLYSNADFYLGNFELTSFTQTQNWSVYAVDRVNEKGKARVTGIYNVYDDQMWLVRELLDSYHLTKNEKYLQKAEYLTAYVLDGWDCTRDEAGNEHGGIPWGPGYVTKHACSNGPMISPLVWLHEIYKNKKDQIIYRVVDAKDKKTRKSINVLKSAYYLNFAQKIYDWQKKYLLNNDGVYADMIGGCDPNCSIQYEEVNGVKYRANTALREATGRAFSYNTGTMISGAADLYRVTKKKEYLADGKQLARASFDYFAHPDAQLNNYYSFATDGFNNWFNTVLLRGYVSLLPFDTTVSSYIGAFRNNLNYAYEHYNKDNVLPTDLLGGWDKQVEKNDIEGMFMFSYVTQMAIFDQTKQYLK